MTAVFPKRPCGGAGRGLRRRPGGGLCFEHPGGRLFVAALAACAALCVLCGLGGLESAAWLCAGLVIRPQQLGAFRTAAQADYVRRMVEHLRTNFPEECRARGYDPESLHAHVSRAVVEAERYGVREEADLQLYLECLALLGPDFDREVDWAADALNRPDLDGTAKMDAIHDHLVVKFINEAASREGV
ncbi:MAG TPA: hypothetical protein VGV38_12815 [Pyrinomonadaceae bacterium]|nr:hypothetical protein [Pyrinomonadaceae bacterium]